MTILTRCGECQATRRDRDEPGGACVHWRRRAPTPRRRIDCRLSNLIYCGGRKRCFLPAEHQGRCGVQPWEPARGPQWYWRVLAWLEGAI